MTIDSYRTAENQPVESLENDSIWNFHVWNEVWTSRKDLSTSGDYDGWQVIDATPQEEAFGRFQCGPAPVKAIKEGKIDIGYETGFIFGEVNADVCFWSVEQDMKSKKYSIQEMIYKSTNEIGNFISTKSVGRNRRWNVTRYYKQSEGSDSERSAFNLAFRLGKGDDHFSAAQDYLTPSQENDLAIEMAVVNPPAFVGDDLKIEVKFLNKSFEKKPERSVVFNGGVYACYSLDKSSTSRHKLITRFKSDEKQAIKFGQEHHQIFTIKALDYFPKLENGNCLTFNLALRDLSDRRICCLQDRKFALQAKSQDVLTFEAPVSTASSAKSTVGQQTEFRLTVKNIFPVDLTNVVVTVEGQHMGHKKLRHGKISAGETVMLESSLRPRKSGNRTIMVDLDAREIQDIKASFRLYVHRA